MADIRRVGDLEIAEDLQYHQRAWTLERIGWSVMLLVIVAALAGLLGPGPLSNAVAGRQGSTLWVEYNRFERYQSPTVLRVHFSSSAAKQGKVRLYLNRDFIQQVRVQRIEPEPESVAVGSQSTAYTFNVLRQKGPAIVVFHYEPNTQGSVPIHVGLHGGPRLSFSQFLYP